jgi:hypothetical protein
MGRVNVHLILEGGCSRHGHHAAWADDRADDVSFRIPNFGRGWRQVNYAARVGKLGGQDELGPLDTHGLHAA